MTGDTNKTKLSKKVQERFFNTWVQQDNCCVKRSASSFEQLYGQDRSNHFDNFINFLVCGEDEKYILDIGSGNGEYSQIAASKKKDAHLVCADISLNSIKQAKQRISSDSIIESNVDYVVCDAEHLPFKPQSFDAIMVIMLLHHLPDLNALKEFSRTLKMSKKLLIVDIVSKNPLRNVYKKIFNYLPLKIKHSIASGDLVLSDGEVPDTFGFSASYLRKELMSSDLKPIVEEHDDLVLFTVFYLLRVAPQFSILFPNIIYRLLIKAEKRILKMSSIRDFGNMITFLCVKK
jgi:ubiquinone/menaquinone biosynthesis C-methylase UbiE